jgi:hypothetical protein
MANFMSPSQFGVSSFWGLGNQFGNSGGIWSPYGQLGVPGIYGGPGSGVGLGALGGSWPNSGFNPYFGGGSGIFGPGSNPMIGGSIGFGGNPWGMNNYYSQLQQQMMQQQYLQQMQYQQQQYTPSFQSEKW